MGSSCEIFKIKVCKRKSRANSFFFGGCGRWFNPLSHTFEVDSIMGFSVPALAGLFLTVLNSLFLHFCLSADPLLIL